MYMYNFIILHTVLQMFWFKLHVNVTHGCICILPVELHVHCTCTVVGSEQDIATSSTRVLIIMLFCCYMYNYYCKDRTHLESVT